MSTAFMTDKYEVTMLQAAMEAGEHERQTTFELFARSLPAGRRYGVAIGAGRVVEAVKDFHFTEEHLGLLREWGINDQTIDYLSTWRFTGTIRGLKEGDLYFPYTPIITVSGKFADCVLLETLLLSIMNHDSAVGSAASRMVNAAKGMPIIEMGSRRTHNESAVSAARAAYIAGFASTSNMEAGKRYGIPVAGTSAHAFTLLFGDEKKAFKAQIDALGVGTTLLVDTYDIEQGINNAIEVAGPELGAIRIDSGDLYEETINARKQLDSLGAVNTKIVLSSDIDEYTIAELMDRGIPVDGVGAGTRVVTGSGHPTASMVYKLVEKIDDDGNKIPVAKKASGKSSIGGAKHPYRIYTDDHRIIAEHFSIGDKDDVPASGSSLHIDLIKNGEITGLALTVEQARAHHAKVLSQISQEAKHTSAGDPYMISTEGLS